MRGPLADIVRTFGGDLHAGGRRASIPGPGHGPGDRSVSLRVLEGGRVLVHCFAGDDWRTVRRMLAARGLVNADGRLCGAGTAGDGTAAPAPGARRRAALALWSEARPVEGTLSARHLRLRAVTRPLGDSLRHHPAAPSAVYEGRGLRRPALLALVADPAGAPCGVEVTYLAADGAKAAMRTPRKLVGIAPAGCAVRLDPGGEEMLVAEGVATTLSASSRFGLPGWALLSAGRLEVWSPPAGVRRILIAADGGVVGMAAANRLAARVRALNLEVRVEAPPPGFGDWNEAAAAEEEGGRAGEGEPDGTDGPDPAARNLIP